jgi:hypothetical protein
VHTFFDYHHSTGLLTFFFCAPFFSSFFFLWCDYGWFLAFLNAPQPQWRWQQQRRFFGLMMTCIDDDVREGAVKKKEEDRRRMRLWLFDRARCSSVSYGRVVIVVKALLLCVNRPWFLSFLCFPSCHSLYLSNKREFIELNESSTSVVSQTVFRSNALEKKREKILPRWT